MGTKFRYKVKLHQKVLSQDLGELPELLRQDLTKYQQILSLDTYKTLGIPLVFHAS
ncbi:hypothetical protein PCC8801_0167 [Rippkaea orientalis PCC 8801]|uniref:Uncharacterized protein n=1 Tax=Rippkaea orientalis (strain PCC 8801 / RF-1) TaxID=41431 RepID=B7K1W4_RIPO1|nr:hypothetical protein PCC8801_0167 [Rippkaea orientalis PCC 8801]